ncbi:MAG: transglycosylase SLT domain-containing protein, partial [Acetobacteraceae bacterium]|nr:transglycosylase SLT domain-containing protein [Acetobacteraceae bacterium]
GGFALLALLAACGGTPQPTVHTPSGPSRASWTPPGPPHDPWGPWIREAARRFDVPERWIREVMRQESGGRAGATSPVGAMGLMQVMPGTYAELRRRHDLGDDPYHPYDNLMAGTAYIREMYDLYGSPAFLAAYNAGPRRLEDYLYNSRGLPAETRNYVARVGPGVIRHSPVRRAPPEVYAAAELPLNVPQGPRRMDAATRQAIAEARSIREQNAQFARLPDAEPRVAPQRFQVAETRAPLPRASGGVVAMEPIADGSTPQGAIRLAEANARQAQLEQAALAASEGAPSASVLAGAPSSFGSVSGAPAAFGSVSGQPGSFGSVAGSPGSFASPSGEQRIIAGRMDPIPDGSTPEGAARLAESAARAQAVASALPPSATAQLAARQPVAAQPVPPRSLGFISTAQASTLPPGFRPVVASTNGWGVQVGAFASENLARSAAQSAQGQVGGRVAVTPVQVGRSTLFRARVTGMSQPQAQQACDRLRGRGACQVVNPES